MYKVLKSNWFGAVKREKVQRWMDNLGVKYIIMEERVSN
jgi:hypothetical protein